MGLARYKQNLVKILELISFILNGLVIKSVLIVLCEIQLLLQSSLDFKSNCEVEGEFWESKRSKYESILDIFITGYPDDCENFPNKEKITKDRLTAKLKSIRNAYKKAVDSKKKSGGGRVVFVFFDLCEKLWQGSPAVTSIANAIDSSDSPAANHESQSFEGENDIDYNDSQDQWDISLMKAVTF